VLKLNSYSSKVLPLYSGLSFLLFIFSCSSPNQKQDGQSIAEKQDTFPVYGPAGHTVPGFHLTNQDSDTTMSKNYRGKILIADFIFTRCATMCPLMTQRMTHVQKEFSDNPQIQIASFTVDPEYDSPEELKKYARNFSADSARWNFYTGSKPAIYELARKGFFLPVDQGDGGPEDFIHSSRFVLVDKQGRIRGYYDGMDSLAVDSLIRNVKRLLVIQ